MKKIFKFALLSTVVLTGTNLVSCSSEEEVAEAQETAVEQNPTFNGETVKTAFTISLPENIGTRMAAATVQESGFRGIDNIKLIPYTLASGDVVVGSTANNTLTALSAITAFDYASSNSKVYADQTFAVGTTNFLFYGKAIDNTAETAISAASDKFTFGTLAVTGLTGTPTLSSVEFTPKSIYTDPEVDISAGQTVGTNLIAALQAVADATPATALSDASSPKFSQVTAAQSATINTMYNRYATLTTASSHSVEAVFKDMYMNLDNLATTQAQSTAPDTYKMAVAIRTAIATYCDITAANGVTSAVTLKAQYQGYPASVNLPDGAVRCVCTSGTFSAATSMNYATNMNVATLESYVYPANLQYFVNSPVKVSNETESTKYGTQDWATILSTLYTDGTAIASSTRSVAITNPINYGVARLDATVNKLTGTYKDANSETVDVSSGFTLTGVLVGGQKSVGWDFAVKGSTVYTIYDKEMPSSATVTTSTGTGTNYTLVLETEAGAQKDIYVALEFVNNGADFKGADGIIPAGGKFYLVGQLRPESGSSYSASTVGKDRVFTKDFKTIANFTIKTNNGTGNEGGLATATNGIPDLRTPQLEIGLSVNLEWQEGLTFNMNL